MRASIPQEVKHEFFLKSLAPLFEASTIDWKMVESQIRNIFEQFFSTTDFAQFCKEGESHTVVTARDQATGKTLGFIQCIVSPDYPIGTIKAGMFGIAPDVTDSIIQELLMSVIFTLIPDTKRILIHVRSTYEKALDLYVSWGFAYMEESQGYWRNLEYLAQQNSRLQDSAKLLG